MALTQTVRTQGQRTLVYLKDSVNLRWIVYYFRRGVHGIEIKSYETPVLQGFDRRKTGSRKVGKPDYAGYDFIAMLHNAARGR